MFLYINKIKNMNIKFFFYLCALLVILTGCTPEFSTNEDYQDVTITYGLLNPNDSAHYVKIYKGFLTDDSPLELASQMESIYYDSIDVVLEEYLTASTPNRTITMERTREIPKDIGIFPNPIQELHYTKARLNQNARYRLKITNKYTGREVYADTKIVNDFYLERPSNNGGVSIFRSSVSKCRISKPINGFQYEIYQIFNYIEVNNITGEQTEHSFRRKLGSAYIEEDETNSYEMNYVPNLLLMALGTNLTPKENVSRYINDYFCIEFEVWVVEKSYATYYFLSNETSITADNRMAFTNFVSEDHLAYGFFSSRNMTRNLCQIDNRSEDSLISGQYTKHLGFRPHTDLPGKSGQNH